MSKVGLPYLPSTLVWTKISLDKYSSVYPTYLSRKFGHFGSKVCPLIHISIEYIEVLLISISSGRSFNKGSHYGWIQKRKNNENSFQTIAKTSSSSSYLGFTILLCKYGLPYLPTLPQKKLSKLFFWKKYGPKIPYLPIVWT